MTWKGYFEKLLMLLQAIKFILVVREREREREREKSHSLTFLQNFVESIQFLILSSWKWDKPHSSKLYGLTWEPIKRISSKHPTKLSLTPLYSHMSSFKACSSRLSQVLIDILYSWYVHSILLLHSFYTSLAWREQFP